MVTVKKEELIKQLSEKYGYTKKSARDLIDDFAGIVLSNLEEGNAVYVKGFGTFAILERKARSCPHPKTGESLDIPAHMIPRFYPGQKMRAVVKMWEDNVKRGLM